MQRTSAPASTRGGDPRFVVLGVDAGAHHVTLLVVQQLRGVLLVLLVVLAEHEVQQAAVGIHDRQGVELMLPDDVVCFLQRRLRWRGDELFQRRHERADLLAAVHAGDAVIAARNDAEQGGRSPCRRP